MIDIQPHLDKLEALRKYLHKRIDNGGSIIYIDLSALPRESITAEKWIRMWNELGSIRLVVPDPPQPIKRMCFDDWYMSKFNLSDQSTW